MVYVNMLILMIVAGICIWYSNKVFRTGYISLIVMVLLFSVLESRPQDVRDIPSG